MMIVETWSRALVEKARACLSVIINVSLMMLIIIKVLMMIEMLTMKIKKMMRMILSWPAAQI